VYVCVCVYVCMLICARLESSVAAGCDSYLRWRSTSPPSPRHLFPLRTVTSASLSISKPVACIDRGFLCGSSGHSCPACEGPPTVRSRVRIRIRMHHRPHRPHGPPPIGLTPAAVPTHGVVRHQAAAALGVRWWWWRRLRPGPRVGAIVIVMSCRLVCECDGLAVRDVSRWCVLRGRREPGHRLSGRYAVALASPCLECTRRVSACACKQLW
jgi:hypothetical protein